ncbi:MAG: hypothetical protein FJ030_14880 [Chloroflexi bacterium]|nr:hypothetical protein [Chloroflexota bacterium]
MTRDSQRTPFHNRPGQAFVELALMLPILLLLIAGMVEVVFAFNDYLQMLDGARNGARDSADLNPYPNAESAYDSIKDCDSTNNFFRRTACSTQRFLLPVDIEVEPPTLAGNTCIPSTDAEHYTNDIVISIFTTAIVDEGSGPELRVQRFNDADWNGGDPHLDEDNEEDNDIGWSFVMDQYTSPQMRGMCSAFDLEADISPLLLGSSDVSNAAPNSGYLLVEVFYRHYQLFDVPAFGDVIANPIPLHAYAIFLLSAAEPTATPEP